ncbi:hypothetical protein IPN41_04100 [Candidatus Falkowbacteria bacterium]|nr:MAG: hypothetical protein IPN41_04100 [Candidatus Falkowbacteria bacterium]
MAIFGGKFKNSFIYVLLLLFTSIFFLVSSPTQAQAASVYFSPSSGQFKVGDSVTVNLLIDSAKDTIDAVSGAVSFTQDTLQVTSLSRSGSILNLWTQEPTFSNSSGTINFKGTALNRGYSGNGGKVIAISFKVIQNGPAYVTYTFGSVLANGDQDTSPLSLGGRAQFTIVGTDTETDNENKEESDTDSDLPTVSRIISSTHSDQNKWYTNNSPELSWSLPDGVLEVRADVGESIINKPTVSYIPPISEKKIEDLKDGRHCFSLMLRNAIGWGNVSYYCLNIDTAPPKHFIIGYRGNGVSFRTVDDLSGLSHYTINVDGQTIFENLTPNPEENFFDTQFLEPGTHTISITAADKAGNIIVATKEILVGGINSPVITYYTSSLESGDDIKVTGLTYPHSLVTIFLRDDKKIIYKESVTSNEAGEFMLLISEPFKAGIYSLTAKVIDNQNMESHETIPLMMIVTFRFMSQIIDLVLRYLSLIILVLLIFAFITFMSVRIWHRIVRLINVEQPRLETKEKIIKKKSRR